MHSPAHGPRLWTQSTLAIPNVSAKLRPPSLEHLPSVGVGVEILRGVDTGVQSRDHLLPKVIAAHEGRETKLHGHGKESASFTIGWLIKNSHVYFPTNVLTVLPLPDWLLPTHSLDGQRPDRPLQLQGPAVSVETDHLRHPRAKPLPHLRDHRRLAGGRARAVLETTTHCNHNLM